MPDQSVLLLDCGIIVDTDRICIVSCTYQKLTDCSVLLFLFCCCIFQKLLDLTLFLVLTRDLPDFALFLVLTTDLSDFALFLVLTRDCQTLPCFFYLPQTARVCLVSHTYQRLAWTWTAHWRSLSAGRFCPPSRTGTSGPASRPAIKHQGNEVSVSQLLPLLQVFSCPIPAFQAFSWPSFELFSGPPSISSVLLANPSLGELSTVNLIYSSSTVRHNKHIQLSNSLAQLILTAVRQ